MPRKMANHATIHAVLTHDATSMERRYAIYQCLIRHLSQEQNCLRHLKSPFVVSNKRIIKQLCKHAPESLICVQAHASLQIFDSEKAFCSLFYTREEVDDVVPHWHHLVFFLELLARLRRERRRCPSPRNGSHGEWVVCIVGHRYVVFRAKVKRVVGDEKTNGKQLAPKYEKSDCKILHSQIYRLYL